MVEEPTRPRWSPGLAWGIWSVAALLTIGAGVLIVGDYAPPAPETFGVRGSLAPLGLFISTLGLLIALRKATNPIGWVYLAGGLGLVITGFSFEYVEVAERFDLPAVSWATWTGQISWLGGVFPAVAFGLLLSPDGHLPSPRWRPLAYLIGGTSLFLFTLLALSPLEYTDLPHPFFGDSPPVPTWLEEMGFASLLIPLPLAAVSVVVRFRRGLEEERLQLKWLAVGGPVATLLIVVGNLIPTKTGEVISSLGPLVLFSAIAAAVLRFRLYDIDLIINRALVYGALTALLGLVYLGAVLLLSRATSPFTPGSDLAVVLSTLLVAALFQPARSKLQEWIDRRFYRSRYDASRVVDDFAGTLRDEVDLDAIGHQLLGAVEKTVRPAHLSMWIPKAKRTAQ